MIIIRSHLLEFLLKIPQWTPISLTIRSKPLSRPTQHSVTCSWNLQLHLLVHLLTLPILKSHQQATLLFASGPCTWNSRDPEHSSLCSWPGWTFLTLWVFPKSLFPKRNLPWSPWLAYPAHSFLLNNFYKWDGWFCQFLGYSSDFSLDYLLVHLLPWRVKSMRKVTLSVLFSPKYPAPCQYLA